MQNQNILRNYIYLMLNNGLNTIIIIKLKMQNLYFKHSKINYSNRIFEFILI